MYFDVVWWDVECGMWDLEWRIPRQVLANDDATWGLGLRESLETRRRDDAALIERSGSNTVTQSALTHPNPGSQMHPASPASKVEATPKDGQAASGCPPRDGTVNAQPAGKFLAGRADPSQRRGPDRQFSAARPRLPSCKHRINTADWKAGISLCRCVCINHTHTHTILKPDQAPTTEIGAACFPQDNSIDDGGHRHWRTVCNLQCAALSNQGCRRFRKNYRQHSAEVSPASSFEVGALSRL